MSRTEPKNDAQESRGRLREILAILARHDIVRGLSPQKLRAIIEDLGPTFVKLGQIMSMRRDMLPDAYCEELARLRTDVKPFDFTDVKNVVEAEYKATLSSIFSVFEEQPIGSASIAQAHAAVLRDGRRVVVKIQRPGIRETMSRDIQLLHRAARLLNLTEVGDVIDLNMVLDEMWAVAQQEMDFLIEAQNAEEFRERNRDVAFVDCPQIEHRHTTAKVLVMEYIDGIQIDDLPALLEEEYDLTEIGLKLADHYIKQIVDDGFFHADPHPGNIKVREGKIVWIDLGMMGRLSARDQELFRAAVKAVVRGDVDELKSILLTIGVYTAKIDHARLYNDIDEFLMKYGKLEIGGMDLGQILEEILSLAKRHRISMPKGISMLGRGVLTLEGVLAVISPEVNLIQIMANRLSSEMLREFDLKHELRVGAQRLYESGRKAIDIPAQMSDLLRMGIRGQAKLNLELLGSEQPLSSIDRMVNKIIKCIFSAALLIGSCMLCTTDMKPRILEIPLLGLLGFAAALLIGAWVLWDMHKDKKR
ncbi:MAG: ABC1 kinase family protein [Intestinibacillus sp.]